MIDTAVHIVAFIIGLTAIGTTVASVSNLHHNTPLWMVIHNMTLMVFIHRRSNRAMRDRQDCE